MTQTQVYSKLNTLFILLFLPFLACNKNDEPSSSIPADAAYDFATLTESTKEGSVFEVRKNGDSPLIRYSSIYDLAASSMKVDVGDRVIICYKRIAGETYTSGPINLYGYARMANTEKFALIGKASDYDQWASEPFDIMAIWRTGDFINLQANLYSYRALAPEMLVIVADETTIADPYPKLHLIYTNQKENNGDNKHDVNASFGIYDIWSLQTCQGVEVYYPTKQGLQCAKFLKNIQ